MSRKTTAARTEPTALPEDDRTRRLLGEFYRATALDHLTSRAPSPQAPRFARREAIVDALWASAPFEADAPQPLPEIDAADLSLPRLLDLSHGFRRPVVIRGFGLDSPAVKAWSADHLAGRVGDVPVGLDGENSPSQAELVRHTYEIPFAEFVRRMREEPLYVFNCGDLTSACPALVDELELDRVRTLLNEPDDTWDPLFTAALFVGTERVFSNVHAAPGGNFFLQVTGRKTWTFVEPALSPYLRPLVRRPFNHVLSAYGTFHTADADCEMHRLPRYGVTLEPGDLLYNAPWWWHEVINHGETIGCAMRHVAPPLDRSPTWHNHRVFSAMSVYPRLWAVSLADYARNRAARLVGRDRPGTLRALVSRQTDREVARARARDAR